MYTNNNNVKIFCINGHARKYFISAGIILGNRILYHRYTQYLFRVASRKNIYIISSNLT